MRVCTLSVSLGAARDAVFSFLADIENLPRWAPEFCERVALSRRGWFALTALGELYLELEADDHAGTIDLRAGDELEPLVLLPMRVLAAPAGGTLVSVVFCQSPGQTEVHFARWCELLGSELANLRERFGGQGHEVAELEPVEAGVN